MTKDLKKEIAPERTEAVGAERRKENTRGQRR